MAAAFSWRRTTAKDLMECLQLRPEKTGAETIGDQRALRAWSALLGLTYAARSALVEMHWQGQVEIVGFGFSTFVKDSFAESELCNPTPGLNRRIIESIDSGRSVVASCPEIRSANTRGTLQQVVLHSSWKENRLKAAQVDEVRIVLGRAYQEIHAGYCIARVLAELVGEADFWNANGHRSFQIVDRFETCRPANPSTRSNGGRALAVATSESMEADPGSIAAEVFRRRRRPQFAFTLREQQLLEVALDGMDDTEAAESLFVSVSAIKRRWATIIERVSAMRPDLCPPILGVSRGPHKRHRILAYIREHPEELRPFNLD